MTIDALRGPTDRARESSADRIAIGEADANIFLCPSCSRPLAVGVSRCAGCKTRLVAGVQLIKVAGFVGLGLAAGMVVGGGVIAGVTATTTSRPIEWPIGEPPAVVEPSAAPVASAPPPVPAVEPAVPSAALSALRQSAIVNQRLLADADRLAGALAAADPSAADIAPILRGLASTATFGDRLAPAVADLDGGSAVSQGMAAFYASISRVADDGLAASLTNARAYADAGKRMLAVLDGLTALDADARALAAAADLELPSLDPAAR